MCIMTETSKYRHSVSGLIGEYTEDQASVFPDYLQPVADDAKPYAPGLFKPGKVGEFTNPEPRTDRQVEAQNAYDSLLTENAPNSKVVRDAKAELEAADADAEKARLTAVAEDEAAEAERVRLEQEAADAAALELAGQQSGDQAGSTGDTASEGK